MTTFKRVLAATDFSNASRHAAERAAMLAHEAGARMQLLHVVNANALKDLLHLMREDSAVEQALVDETGRALNALATDLARSRGIEVETNLIRGSVIVDIGSQAETFDADVVVLGARGAGFMRRLLLGSTAERLLHRAVRPVLVVKQRPHERYRRVLLPVDFSPWSAASLDLVRRIAHDAHFVLLHAFEVPFEGKLRFAGVDETTIESYRTRCQQVATQQLDALAATAGLRPTNWTPCILQGDASLHIVEQEEQQDCDLIVIGKHGQNKIEELLLGSVTKHVLAESTSDVLVSTLKSP